MILVTPFFIDIHSIDRQILKSVEKKSRPRQAGGAKIGKDDDNSGWIKSPRRYHNKCWHEEIRLINLSHRL